MSKLKLSEHIKKLKAKEAANPQKADNAILFWGDYDDKAYLPHLKGCVGGVLTYTKIEPVNYIKQLSLHCKNKRVNRVITSNLSLLKLLLKWDKRAAPSLDNYAGSFFRIPAFEAGQPDIEIVILPPIRRLVTKAYGKFMATRYITKLTKPDTWFEPPEFTGWTLLTATNEADLFDWFSTCDLICIDIETFRENATIRCLSYTGFYYHKDRGVWISDSVVLPLDSEYNLAIMRKWNWKLKAPKVFQNGKYDIAYLTRYNAPVYNYLYDTANLFHSWYSELPKDLGFLNAFFIREAVYWKDLSETNDLYEYYKYNALDTWGTGSAFLAMMLEAPKFAIDNYLLEFPLTFPCHLCEMTGIDRDMEAFEIAAKEQKDIVDRETKSLNTMLGAGRGQSFNVKSSPQKKALFKMLGCGDLPKQDEKSIQKARFRHPFNARILGKMLDIIKSRTLLSNYLTPGKQFSRLDGTGSRFLYSLNPHGTDSGRLASKSHHFWTGDNIQKIPSGPIVKQTFKADPGFLLCEVDLEQAESRDTAYISGDEALIKNVETSPDFHCANASAFFGIPFEELFNHETGKVLNKAIRTLAKRVNHGANYNMGGRVLVETMGEKHIIEAGSLLNLPKLWSYIQIAEHLLEQFHKTYPKIKNIFYRGVVEEVCNTNMISSAALHWDWQGADKVDELKKELEIAYAAKYPKVPAHTRYCFGDPTKSKPVLNSYVSHPPQNLNAMTLNRSFLSVFHDIAMHPEHSDNFKLLAQIHDSIFFQYRIGHDYLIPEVVSRMEVPVTIKAYDGKIRTFVVPAGAKRGQHLEGDKKDKATYWSETE